MYAVQMNALSVFAKSFQPIAMRVIAIRVIINKKNRVPLFFRIYSLKFKGIGGKNCNQRLSVNSDPCLTNPCYNNAICLTLPNNQFQCQCNSNLGFFGLVCKSYNQCQCLNGGTCMPYNYNSALLYDCLCPTGFG